MVQDNQAKQTVFVVGAGSGIGRGIAEAFEVQGFRVYRADLSYSTKSDNNLEFYVDAIDGKSVNGLVQHLVENLITPDYLIITIGAIDEGNIADYSAEHLSWIIEINLIATYRLVQHFLPLIRNSKDPKILLTGSAAGLGSFDETYKLMPYIIAKHALMGCFKAIHQDLGKEGIQVSLFIPNRIKGNLSENSAIMRARTLKEVAPTEKGAQQANVLLAEPKEIATPVIEEFLAGKKYITNNPAMIIDKLEQELLAMKRELGYD